MNKSLWSGQFLLLRSLPWWDREELPRDWRTRSLSCLGICSLLHWWHTWWTQSWYTRYWRDRSLQYKWSHWQRTYLDLDQTRALLPRNTTPVPICRHDIVKRISKWVCQHHYLLYVCWSLQSSSFRWMFSRWSSEHSGHHWNIQNMQVACLRSPENTQ